MTGERVNPRRAQLRRLIDQAAGIESGVSGALGPAESAMEAGAWVSSVVGPFEDGLAEAGRDIRRAAAATVDALEAEWRATPTHLPADEPV